MAKIYVVTKGSYSDYHIVAATLDKEKAEKIKKKFDSKYDECEIEEYEDSETILKPLYIVVFDINRSLLHIRNRSTDAWSYYDKEHTKIYEYSTNAGFYIYVSADDEDHALKIARDKLAEYLAEKEGVKC